MPTDEISLDLQLHDTIRMKRKSHRLEKLTTEQPNRASTDLDLKSGLEIARIINREDARLPAAIAQALPQIGRAIDLIAAQLRKGGRLIYVGTGTSGRVGALDASECAPTFGIDPSKVQFMPLRRNQQKDQASRTPSRGATVRRST